MDTNRSVFLISQTPSTRQCDFESYIRIVTNEGLVRCFGYLYGGLPSGKRQGVVPDPWICKFATCLCPQVHRLGTDIHPDAIRSTRPVSDQSENVALLETQPPPR